MTETSHDALDRYLRGELSVDEQRALLRQSLEDEDLFEFLATLGTVTEALQVSPLALSSQRASGMALPPAAATATVVPPVRRLQPMIWIGPAFAAAVALMLAVVMQWRATAPAEPAGPLVIASGSTRPQPVPPAPRIPLDADAAPGFLAMRLELPVAVKGNARPVFRASGEGRTLAQTTGTIGEVEGAEARVDLGTIDGLDKGTILIVEADPASALPESHATVISVRRETATLAIAGEVRTGQRVRVTPTISLLALSDQIRSGAVTGDSALVERAAQEAARLASSSEADAAVRRTVHVQLAALARRFKDGAAAERYLREAARLTARAPAATPTERAEILSALGTVVAGRRGLDEADHLLRLAHRVAPRGSVIEADILNNRGFVKALRDSGSDRTDAETLYKEALALLPPREQRRRSIVEKNLSLVQASR